MPILDRRNNQFIEDKDTRVSVGIDFPFAIVPNKDGYFVTTKTTIESALVVKVWCIVINPQIQRPFYMK